MKYKMLALDLDGTLTNSNKDVTEKTKAALRRAAAAGVRVVLASGRPTAGMLHVADEVDLKNIGGILLAYNGGVIMDYTSGKILSEKVIPNDLLSEVEDFIREEGVVGAITYTERTLPCTCVTNEYAQLEERITKMPLVSINSLSGFMAGKSVWKVILPGEGERMGQLEPKLAEKFKGRLGVGRSEPFFLEVRPLGVDKARGLAALGEMLGIKQEEIIACGDSFNDLEMIEYAGLGVAMANAQQCIKDVANHITLSNDEDGIAAMVEKFID